MSEGGARMAIVFFLNAFVEAGIGLTGAEAHGVRRSVCRYLSVNLGVD